MKIKLKKTSMINYYIHNNIEILTRNCTIKYEISNKEFDKHENIYNDINVEK